MTGVQTCALPISGPQAWRGLGRPRLRLGRARAGLTRPGDRAADQQAPPARRADPRRRGGHRDLARAAATTEKPRPASPAPLAGRAHQQLAPRLATRRCPLGTTTRTLARRDPNRSRHHPLQPTRLIPLAAPVPITKVSRTGPGPGRTGSEHRGETFAAARPARSARSPHGVEALS